MKMTLNEKNFTRFKQFSKDNNINYEVINSSSSTAMIWSDGPVIIAMRRGAVLCLDEIDQSRTAIMCLNTIAQGKPYYIKKTNELVVPKEGFTLIGTANTKGDGEGMDKFSGAQIMNEAFLERFSIIVEQEYPNKETETKILQKHTDNKAFIKNLIDIAHQVRVGYDNGDLDILLTTRRLVHIAKNFEIFEDKEQALSFAIARFSYENQEVIKELYFALVKEQQLEEDRINRRNQPVTSKNNSSSRIFDTSTKVADDINSWFDSSVVTF